MTSDIRMFFLDKNESEQMTMAKTTQIIVD